MDLVRIPRVLEKIFPDLTWAVRTNEPVLYLTFDDGPTPGVTAGVLEVLERYSAKATFFCIGRNVERHPDIYRQILAAGHTTGNHTYSHLKGWYTPDRQYYDDIALAAQLIQSGLYRPAYGMITPAQVKFLKNSYRIILWNIMTYDFARNISPQKCLQNAIRYTVPGSVIVFHDSVKASYNVMHALPATLEYFSQRGFTFKSLE